MKKSASIIVSIVVLAVVFGLGYMCACLPFGSGNSWGDVAKVSRFSKATVSPEASAFQEKIMSSEEEFKKVEGTLELLSRRMDMFDELVRESSEAAKGIDALAPVVGKIEGLATLSGNAKEAARKALDSFAAMAEGKPAGAADYETASQNLYLAYLAVSRKTHFGKTFVTEVDSFMKGKKAEDYENLLKTSEGWASFCATDAYISRNEGEIAYWRNKYLTNSAWMKIESLDFANIICDEESAIVPIICNGNLTTDEDARFSNPLE